MGPTVKKKLKNLSASLFKLKWSILGNIHGHPIVRFGKYMFGRLKSPTILRFDCSVN